MQLHPDQKIAGVLTPLFALRGKNDLGIGDTHALKEAILWAKENGFRALQLLPINELGDNNSPYSIISAMALEPSTITTHPDWMRELPLPTYQKILHSYDIDALQAGPVNYPIVRKLKSELLTAAWNNFNNLSPFSIQQQDYARFEKETSLWLADYTLYRALLEKHHENSDFSFWKPELRQASTAYAWLHQLPQKEQKHIASRRHFFAYIQWIAFRQWQQIFSFASQHQVALIGDVPTGVSLGSADVFAHPELFDTSNFGGAPPEKVFQSDPFTMQWGQNWGIPLYHWEKMSLDNFSWWRHRLQHLRSLFHLLRIDHALGLFRIYSFPWKPEKDSYFVDKSPEEAQKITGGPLPHFRDYDDTTVEHRAYNQRRGEMLLRLFLAETGKNHLLAEDLGESPAYVTESLKKLQIPGFKIPLWTRDETGHMLPPEKYPRLSIATYATHDHAPLRKQWEHWQTEAQKTPPSLEAKKTLLEMLHFAHSENESLTASYLEHIHLPLLNKLYTTNSWIAIVMITDLFGSQQQFNLPGSPSAQNWRERIVTPVGYWNSTYKDILTASYKDLKKTNRIS